MSTALTTHIDNLIAENRAIQVGLRNHAQPIGPGKCELIKITDAQGSPAGSLYRMTLAANMQATPQSRPQAVSVPFVFDGDDVVLVIEEPRNADGDAAIITPGNGRTAGGLHIPGR